MPIDKAPGFWNYVLGMGWSKSARELGKGSMVIDLPLYLHAPKVRRAAAVVAARMISKLCTWLKREGGTFFWV